MSPALTPTSWSSKPGNEGVRTELDADILAVAALEFGAVDAADEIDHDAVAVDSLALLGLEGAVLLGHALERFVDLGLGHLDDRLLDRHVLEVDQIEDRQHFERDGEGQIALGVHGLLDLVLVLGELDLRLEGKLEAVVLDDLAVGLVDGVLDHIAHDRAAINPAQVPDRHLAGAEPVDLDPVLESRQLVVEPLLQLRCREHDLEFPLQALGQSFRHLHGSNRLHSRKNLRPGPRSTQHSCIRSGRRAHPETNPDGIGAGGGTRTPTTFAAGT